MSSDVLCLDISAYMREYSACRASLFGWLKQTHAKRVAIWGAGVNGRLTSLLLNDSSYSPTKLYDAQKSGCLLGIPILPEPSRLDSGDVILLAMNGPFGRITTIKRFCARQGVGQRGYRAALVVGQVRECLSERLLQWNE
jgi:hypothetical protein